MSDPAAFDGSVSVTAIILAAGLAALYWRGMRRPQLIDDLVGSLRPALFLRSA